MGTEGNTSIARRHWAGWFPLALTKLSVRGVNRKLLIFYQVSYVCSSEREDLGKVGEPNTCNTVLLVQGNLAPWDCCSPLHPFLKLVSAVCRQVSFGLCPPAVFPSQREYECAAVSWSWKVSLGRGGGWGPHRGRSSSWATTVTSAVTKQV